MSNDVARVVHFKNFLQEENVVAEAVSVPEEQEVKFKDIISKPDTLNTVEEIPVVFHDTDTITINKITDSKGRLSDSLEAISAVTGFNSLPLSVTSIPPEITSLQRHKLYTLCGVRYAMAQTIREGKINSYCNAIVQNLQDGVPYITNLIKDFEYCGNVYQAPDLTEGEWTLILSKFRSYKQRLYVKDGTQLILEVYPESPQ